jgi:cholesterol oxidase
MDGAAFPGPVGANPSATIAALAEYKIERFLKAQPETAEIRKALDALQQARAEAKASIDAAGRRGQLDPLGPNGRVPPQGTSATPFHRPVGIEFEERMTGSTYSESEKARSVATDLKVRIDDLAGFLVSHSRDSRARIPIADGKLELDGVAHELDGERSYMQVMVDDTRDEARQRRTIIYELTTTNEKYRLSGTKYVRDDPGPDLLDDTTTLSFELHEEGKTHTGTLTLSVEELFGSQIPGFKVTTDDPARQAWAMASFVRFFFGNLVDVYVPPLRPLTELVTNLTRRGHG